MKKTVALFLLLLTSTGWRGRHSRTVRDHRVSPACAGKRPQGKDWMMCNVISLFAAILGSTLAAASASEDTLKSNRDYTYLYFENGYPTRLKGRRSQNDANVKARANPDLVIQTGYYSLRLDCDDMELTGYDVLAGSDYLTALTQDVTIFSPAHLSLTVVTQGKTYTCTHARVQDRTTDYVRLVQSGQFVQRFDHLGLVFSAADGAALEGPARFEVTAWPDRVVFLLDVSAVSGVSQSKIQLTSPSGRIHRSVSSSGRVILALQPHLDQEIGNWQASSYIREAVCQKNGKALQVRFDEEENALHVDTPAERVVYPAAARRVDEYAIEVHNPTESARTIPLVFDQEVPRAITGTVMLLCQNDGRPSGIPVQISKNWHRDKSHPTVHQGAWLRGYTMIPVAAGATRRYRLRVVYGYWAGAGAVSHAQLSVIGYGGNWKWDESALGAWGESMTYDPTQHLGAAFIDDVRPAFTTSRSGKDHGWTENVGGGDFLIYYDQIHRFRWAKRLKTAYRWTGPNMTEVRYSGITDDEKIRFVYTTRSVRTNDYHRRFHAYEYRFLGDVIAPRRLVFHQMAADYYTGPSFTQFYRGDETGMLSSDLSDPGGNRYKGDAFPFDGQWLAIDDETCADGRTKAQRGIVSLVSTLNGRAFPLHLHTYGRSWGAPRMLFDLSSESVRRSYRAGDVVVGELEFILPSKTVDDYWGKDIEFRNRLASYRTRSWQAVCDEYRYNCRMSVTAHVGTLLRTYPVEIQALVTEGVVFADFTVNSGGIGHVPVVLMGVPADRVLQVQRRSDGVWVALESVDTIRHDYYQGYRNPQGTLDCVFNITRPSSNLKDSWRVRIVSSPVSHE